MNIIIYILITIISLFLIFKLIQDIKFKYGEQYFIKKLSNTYYKYLSELTKSSIDDINNGNDDLKDEVLSYIRNKPGMGNYDNFIQYYLYSCDDIIKIFSNKINYFKIINRDKILDNL